MTYQNRYINTINMHSSRDNYLFSSTFNSLLKTFCEVWYNYFQEYCTHLLRKVSGIASSCYTLYLVKLNCKKIIKILSNHSIICSFSPDSSEFANRVFRRLSINAFTYQSRGVQKKCLHSAVSAFSTCGLLFFSWCTVLVPRLLYF